MTLPAADPLTIASDVASILGLAVTVVGFGIAIHQIRQTKSASEQARATAESVRTQILQLNAIQGVQVVIKALEDIRRLHRHRVWESLPDRYTSLKQELISIKGRTPNLGEEQKAHIQGAIQQVSMIEREVEGAIGGANQPDVERINIVVSKQIDRLAQVLVDLQNEIDRPRH